MDMGWVYYAYAVESDALLQLSGVKRISKGYLAQEIERRMNRG